MSRSSGDSSSGRILSLLAVVVISLALLAVAGFYVFLVQEVEQQLSRLRYRHQLLLQLTIVPQAAAVKMTPQRNVEGSTVVQKVQS